MSNSEVTLEFQDIAILLELKKENPFKIRTYQKVSHSIEDLSIEVEHLVTKNRLKEVPATGEAITGKITELETTGKLNYYQELKAEFSKKKLYLA